MRVANPVYQQQLIARNLHRDNTLALCLLIAVASYQALLCLINTNLFTTSRAMIGLSEALIMLACLPILLRRILPGITILICISGAVLTLLTLISGVIDLKAFRDLMIPLLFFWLGCNLGRPELADRGLAWLMGILILFGLVELLFLDLFTQYFNIYRYYVDTGSLREITEYSRESSLQLNGMRPEGIGRTLLPGLLGSHRVSSLFLEPVSLGNFATLAVAWWLCRERPLLRRSSWLFAGAIALIIMSDSRFALITVSLLLALRFLLPQQLLGLAILAPLAGILLVAGAAFWFPDVSGDNYLGRLVISGHSLLGFTSGTWLGLPDGHFYGDQGYAYALSNFGWPLLLLLWLSLWLQPVPDAQAARFRAFASLYMALLLCISGTSLFAFKSAGLLWFLLGCSLRQPALTLPSADTETGAGVSRAAPPRMQLNPPVRRAMHAR